MANEPTHDRFVLESRLEEVAPVEQAILEAAATYGFDESACFGIRLSLEEALTNAIKHGNQYDRSKKVMVDYLIDDQKLSITISDEGCGFCPTEIPDPTLDENLERPCGRGIMLIRAFMDDVLFSEDGKSVTMIKLKI